MKFRNTIILLVVFLLLGGYVYIVEIKQHEKKKAEKEKQEKIFPFAKDSIIQLQVKNKHGTFVFEKKGNDWHILKPISTLADNSPINTALSNLTTAKKKRHFTIKESEKKEFGLTSKALRVKVKLKNGEEDSLWLGDKTPVGGNVFASRGDTLVFTIPQYVKSSLNKNLFNWRDKKLLHFKRADVQRMVIRNKYGRFEFVRSGNNQWTINNIHRPADSGELSTVFSKLEYGRARSFVDEEGTHLRKYGLKPPAYQVDLFLNAEKGSRTLLVSRKIKKKYYAHDVSRKPIFEVDSSLVKAINKPLVKFRSRDFAQFERDKVDRIKIQYDDTTLAFVKDTTNTWYLDEKGMPKAKYSEISGFLSDLDFIQIKEFVADDHYSEKRFGLDKPQLRVKLFHGDKLLLEARFGRSKGDKVYATTSAYKSVYLVNKSDMKDLKLKRDKVLESTSPKAETTKTKKAA